MEYYHGVQQPTEHHITEYNHGVQQTRTLKWYINNYDIVTLLSETSKYEFYIWKSQARNV